MRIEDHDYRDVRGVQVRRLPLARKDSLAGVPAAMSMALDYLKAATSPLHADWAAVFGTLRPILEPVEKVDLERLAGGDTAEADRVTDIVSHLARWHDAVWYPKGEALVDALMQDHPKARTADANLQGHYQAVAFLEECPKMLLAWGADCQAAEAERAMDAAMAGKSMQEAMSSPEVSEAIAAASEHRKEAAALLQDRSVAELAEEFQEPGGPAPRF